MKNLTPHSAVMYVVGALITSLALIFALWLPSTALRAGAQDYAGLDGAADMQDIPSDTPGDFVGNSSPDPGVLSVSPTTASRTIIRHGLLADYYSAAANGYDAEEPYAVEEDPELCDAVFSRVLEMTSPYLGTYFKIYGETVRYGEIVALTVMSETDSFELYCISAYFESNISPVSFVAVCDPEDQSVLLLTLYADYDPYVYLEESGLLIANSPDYEMRYDSVTYDLDVSELAHSWGEQLGLSLVLTYTEDGTPHYTYSSPDTGGTVTYGISADISYGMLALTVFPE